MHQTIDKMQTIFMLRILLSLFLICTAGLGLSPSALAQDEDPVNAESVGQAQGLQRLSLDQAISRVLSVNPGIESAQKDLLISQAQFEEARNVSILPKSSLRVLGGLVPDVPNGSGPENNFPEVDTSLTDLGPFLRLRLEAFQPIYTFGKISNLRKAAKLGVQIKEEGVELARNQLIYETKRAYYGLEFLQSMKAFIEDLQIRAHTARDIVEDMLKKPGTEVTDIDLMRIDLFIAETERRMVEAINNIDFTKMVLKVLMASPREEDFEIESKEMVARSMLPLQSVEEYLELAHEHRPEIAQIEAGVEARKYLMLEKRSQFFPTLGIGGFYNFGLAPGRQEVNNPFLVDQFHINSGGGALGLEQNLSFHMTQAKHKKAKAEYEKTLADQQRAFQGIEIEVRNAHTQAMSKYQAVESSQKALKHGRSWVLASTLNFGTGIAPPKDLLEAFIGYSTVKATFFETLYSYHNSLAVLSKAVGMELADLKY
ncbi:MAG: TolC family protein [Bdellovibrionales bacterium]|nr:TolC family protein [Bdellovibrionales bacterium]